MAARLNTYIYKITTTANTEVTCLLPASNFSDALTRFMNQGFLVTMEGKILPYTACTLIELKLESEGADSYLAFAKSNEDLMKGLRLS